MQPVGGASSVLTLHSYPSPRVKFSLQGALDLRLEFLLFLKFIDTLLLAHFTVCLYW